MKNSPEQIEFKTAYKEFRKALDYIEANTEKLKKNPKTWANVKINFQNKFAKRLDKAWDALSEAEQDKFYAFYFIRLKDKDEEVKKIFDAAEEFNGTILSVDGERINYKPPCKNKE
jgi:hypothetical protein